MKYKFILFILVFGLKIEAQVPDLFQVQFDRDYYVASEDIWFNVHFLNENQIESKVLYVDVIDPSGVLVLQEKLKIDEKNTFGDFRIPPDWKEGLYTFRAYTYWNLNFGSKFIFTKPIPIYGLEEPKLNTEVGSFQKPDFQIFTPSFQENEALLGIRIETEKEQYQPREKIKIDIEIKDESGNPIEGNFSVSVKNTDFFSRKTHPAALLRQKQKLEKSLNELDALETFQFPLEQGLRMRVHILNDTMVASISYLPPVYFVENRTKVSSELQWPPLTFLMDEFYGSRNLQLLDFQNFEQDKDYLIEKTSDFLSLKGSGQTALSHTPEVDGYINRVCQQRKMEQIFLTKRLSPLPDYPSVKLADKANKIYKIDDFATFKDIFDFTEEVIGVPLARIINKKDNKRGIRLFNQDHNRKLSEQPLYLINNFVEFDEEKALSIEWENVERIELITRDVPMVQHFGTLGINGVFAIYTRDGKIPDALKKANYNTVFEGFYFPRTFELPDYNTKLQSNNRKPDIRSTEYWNPSLNIRKKGKTSVEFFASDARGRYLIHVEGVTKTGRLFIGETSYQIR